MNDTLDPSPVRRAVAFVGIGNMGFGMAARLLSLGWPVHVCDLDPQRCQDAAALGAAVHASPAEAGSFVVNIGTAA